MAMPITVEVPDLVKLESDFKRAPSKVTEEIEKALTKSAILIQRNAIKESPIDTGRLRSNIIYRVFFGTAVISPNVDYAVYVHEGTRPHSMPFNAVEPWARRKGIPAGAVWQSIRHKGTKGNPFMRRAAEQSGDGVRKFFKDAADNVGKFLAKG